MGSGICLVSTECLTLMNMFSLVKLCQKLGMLNPGWDSGSDYRNKNYLENLTLQWIPIATYLTIRTLKNLAICFLVIN